MNWEHWREALHGEWKAGGIERYVIARMMGAETNYCVRLYVEED